MLADTGWTPWLAFAGVCLVALGVVLRRAATTRRSTKSPFTHPALLDRVPTQRGETTRAVTDAAVGSARGIAPRARAAVTGLGSPA